MGDENKARGNWSSEVEFSLSIAGSSLGLSKLWRFPYLCYKNGGGAFFIPYFIMLMAIGVPLLLIELGLGQFSSCGTMTCWQFSPIFKGLGYGMVFITTVTAVYYSVLVGWGVYYLYASFTTVLPWQSCGDWSTNLCYENVKILNASWEKCGDNRWGKIWIVNSTQGICYEPGLENRKAGVRAYIDKLLATKYFPRTLASEEYYEYCSTGAGYSSGLDDIGQLNWKITICTFLVFVCIVISLQRSIKSSGKVAYFTFSYPCVVMIVLLVRGLMLEGMEKGIYYIITPDMAKLSQFQVWKDAAAQVFFSLNIAMGGSLTLSSYNTFHNDFIKSAVFMIVCDIVASALSGLLIFSFLGYLSLILEVPIEDVVHTGPSLSFIIFPFAMTKMPLAPVWSGLFFTMLIVLSIGCDITYVNVVLTSTMDILPGLRKHKFLTVSVLCFLLFCSGIILTTNGGIYIIQVIDTHLFNWSIILIGMTECISVAWIYGFRRFLHDVKLMVGNKFCGCFPFSVCKYWLIACWCFLTPVTCMVIIIFTWYDYKGMQGSEFNASADWIGWCITLAIVFIPWITVFCQLKGAHNGICKKIRQAAQSDATWGPALVQFRKKAEAHTRRYSDVFTVDITAE